MSNIDNTKAAGRHVASAVPLLTTLTDQFMMWGGSAEDGEAIRKSIEVLVVRPLVSAYNSVAKWHDEVEAYDGPTNVEGLLGLGFYGKARREAFVEYGALASQVFNNSIQVMESDPNHREAQRLMELTCLRNLRTMIDMARGVRD